MTMRSGPAESGTSRHRYWPGLSSLDPNASSMSTRAWPATSDASILACSVSIATAGAEPRVVARTHETESASTEASCFILHLNFIIDFCGNNALLPSRVPLGLSQVIRRSGFRSRRVGSRMEDRQQLLDREK